MTVLHGIPDFITAQRFCKDTYATVTVTARITCMLVGRTHNTEFLTLLQSALNSTFPLAGTHVMQITVISLIAFCQSMAGIHLYKRGLVSFRKEVPIVSAIACLISHMMRSNKYLMPAGFPFPVFNGGTFHQRCVQVIIQSHMIAMFHAVRLITNKSQEFSFLIVFIGHGDIFLITSLSQTLESTGMIIDHPLQTGIIGSGNIRPHGMRSDRYKIQLFFGSLKCRTHVAMTVGYVTMIMQISPEILQITGRGHDFLSCGSSLLTCR